MTKPVREIDGANFSNLSEFYDEITKVLIDPGRSWGRNLSAFNDILRGGFGTPKGGFVFVWKNSDLSRDRFGYAETIRWKEEVFKRCHPSNRKKVMAEIEDAKCGRGQTIFDVLVEIISVHCAGGREEIDGIELVLR